MPAGRCLFQEFYDGSFSGCFHWPDQQTILAQVEHFIENLIGYFPLPLGLAAYFRIDGRDVPIPMAIHFAKFSNLALLNDGVRGRRSG